MADIFDVVADTTRRMILQVLLERYLAPESDSGEIRVAEIVERIGVSQPTVSKHLAVLRENGLARVREDGQRRFYSVDPAPLEEIEDWLIPFLSADFDSSRAGDDEPDVSGAFAAWSGAGAGHRVGRVVAEKSHRARTALEEVQAQLAKGIRRVQRRVDGESH